MTPNKKSISQIQYTDTSVPRKLKTNNSASRFIKASNIGAYLNGRDSTYIKQFASMMRKKYRRKKMVSDTLPGINGKRTSISTELSNHR